MSGGWAAELVDHPFFARVYPQFAIEADKHEHVASPDRLLARVQRLVDALFWPKIGAGCHCSRDTLATIERAGFVVESCRRFRFKPSPLIGLWTLPHILAVARRA